MPTKSSGQEDSSSPQASVEQRRELLGSKLNNYKQEKLKRKLPVDSQLLTCAKEDIQLKKLIDQMNRMDKQHSENMGKLSSNMDKLTNCISDEFSLLQGLIYPPPAAGTYQQPYAGYNPPQQSGMIFNPVQFPDYRHPAASGGLTINDVTTEFLH